MAEPKRPPLRVMLVDDHEVVRDGIRAMLAPEAEPDAMGNEPFARWKEQNPQLKLGTFADAGRAWRAAGAS